VRPRGAKVRQWSLHTADPAVASARYALMRYGVAVEPNAIKARLLSGQRLAGKDLAFVLEAIDARAMRHGLPLAAVLVKDKPPSGHKNGHSSRSMTVAGNDNLL